MERRVRMLREEFIALSEQEGRNISALCKEFGISRKTGYKWIKRYQECGNLEDQNRKPKTSRSKTDEKIERLVFDLRQERPGWGARKIQAFLCQKGYEMPCIRTVNNILKRNGLISLAASLARKPFMRFEREKCNELWQADFKGDILMIDGDRCYPLTILDDHSRYALLIEPRHDQRDVLQSFIPIFRLYGRPEAILTDNGRNFAGLKNGYTLFERALMDQDILPIHGRFYHPQTQGKIERFHRSMENEVLKLHRPINFADATEVLDQWKAVYNFERPHEALGDRCPAQVYTPSLRQYLENIPPYDYDSQYHLIKINNWGYLRFADFHIYISETFRDTRVQLIPSEGDDSVLVCYRNFTIAKIDVTSGDLLSRKAYRLRSLYNQ
ncbi:MAG: IS481 family transposase [Anaerolinea sp.]|nr:IS481 family transposase [Anaerolinea sp.]